MADDEAELVLVEQELESVAQELEQLFARQSALQERRRELQQLLYVDGSEVAAVDTKNEPPIDWAAPSAWTPRVRELLRDRVRSVYVIAAVAYEVVAATHLVKCSSAWRRSALCRRR